MQTNSTDFLVGIEQQNVRKNSQKLSPGILHFLNFHFEIQWDKLILVIQVVDKFNLGWQAVVSRTVTAKGEHPRPSNGGGV